MSCRMAFKKRGCKSLFMAALMALFLSITATPSIAEFSPADMQQAVGLMSDLFGNLQRSQEFLNYAQREKLFIYDTRDIPRGHSSHHRQSTPLILRLRIDLFNLSSAIGSFQQQAAQNSLDKVLFVYARDQIAMHVDNLQASFSDFRAEVFGSELRNRRRREQVRGSGAPPSYREQYADLVEMVSNHLEAVDNIHGDLFGNIENSIENRQPTNQYGHLLSGLQQQILSVDMPIFGIANALGQP